MCSESLPLSWTQKSLKDAMVRLGELDHAMDDVIEVLQKTQNDLQQLEDVYGDPKFVETHLKKLQVTNIWKEIYCLF